VRGEKAFSEEEIVKLQAALGLDSKDVDLLLETIEFILQQVMFHFQHKIPRFSKCPQWITP